MFRAAPRLPIQVLFTGSSANQGLLRLTWPDLNQVRGDAGFAIHQCLRRQEAHRARMPLLDLWHFEDERLG